VLATVKVRPGNVGICGTVGATADLDGVGARRRSGRQVGAKERLLDRTKERIGSSPYADFSSVRYVRARPSRIVLSNPGSPHQLACSGLLLCGSTESEALSVAFAIHLDDRGVMDQSVDGCRRHGGIGKDSVPGRKRLVGGDSDAVSFVSMGDEFEQDAGLGLILANIRDVVEDDEVVFVELLEGADQGDAAVGPYRWSE
jgi:hypothetical protein